MLGFSGPGLIIHRQSFSSSPSHKGCPSPHVQSFLQQQNLSMQRQVQWELSGKCVQDCGLRPFPIINKRWNSLLVHTIAAGVAQLFLPKVCNLGCSLDLAPVALSRPAHQ